MVSESHTRASYTFEDLDAGTYEVTVTSAVGPVLGQPTQRASFKVQGKMITLDLLKAMLLKDVSSCLCAEPEFPLLPVVIGAAAGGVVLVIIVIIIIVIAVYCSCINRK